MPPAENRPPAATPATLPLARTCTCCGLPLSKYNPEDLCQACTSAARDPATPGRSTTDTAAREHPAQSSPRTSRPPPPAAAHENFTAVVERHMNARGMGVRATARATGYADHTYISRVLHGHQKLSPYLAAKLDRALQADGEITAAARTAIAAAARCASRQPAKADTGPHPADPETATAPADATARAVITAIGATLHAVPADQCPERDRASVERDVMRAWELRQSSEYARLGSLLTNLLRHTASTAASSEASVHVCNMASSLLKRLGAYEMAAVLADRAFRAASQTGSGLLVSAAKLRVANVYLSASHHAEAVAVAADAADDLPPRKHSAPEEVATFGALLLTAAVAAAKMGETAQAWEFLGHARAATAVHDHEHADLYAVFGPVNLAVHGVQVATELGDGREALRRADKTDPRRMPAVLLERRSTLLIDIARAQHMQHDQAAAAETLIEAERVAPLEVRYSGAARVLLSELLSARAHPSTELRQLAGRLLMAA